MKVVDLYLAVEQGKMTIVEFMRALDEREMESWKRGYDTGHQAAKIVYAPIEFLKAEQSPVL